MRTETLELDFEGHRLAYRVSGRGPALVVISQYWRKEDEVHVRVLGHQWQVFHITPIGYGRSDRVPGYAGKALAVQVHAVLEHHSADRFVIWGYSAGGAMAACVARSTPRAAGLICGGFNLFDPFSPGTVRQLDRRLHPEHASRSLWSWVNSFDWTKELCELSRPCLLYWGSDDRQMAASLRSSRTQLFFQAFDFVELAGLDHGGCGSSGALAEQVLPMLQQWIYRRVGPVW